MKQAAFIAAFFVGVLGGCGGGSGAPSSLSPGAVLPPATPPATQPGAATTPATPATSTAGLTRFAGQVGENYVPPAPGSAVAYNGLVVDGQGGVVSAAGLRILAISSNGQATVLADSPDSCLFQGLVRAPDASLYATCGYAVYRLPANGKLELFAGAQQADIQAPVDGPAAQARFGGLGGIVMDGQGRLIVVDTAFGQLRTIAPDGIVSTLAGKAALPRAVVDGAGSAASFVVPEGIAIAPDGMLYVTDSHTVRRVTPLGVVTTVAGKAGVAGWVDGAAGEARFKLPKGLATDKAGNVYIADTDNSVIRKLSPAGVVSTVAGSPWQVGSNDGLGENGTFYYPFNVVSDADGVLYIADTFNGTIRKVTPAGSVSTLAGTPVLPKSSGSIDGSTADARFYDPHGVALDTSGNVFVADYGNQTIRKISNAGQVTTLAGSAHSMGDVNARGVLASFQGPDTLVIDGKGDLYTVDKHVMSYGTSLSIRRITQQGEVSTFALPVDPLNLAPGVVVTGRGVSPLAIGVDTAGNFYFVAVVSTSADCYPKLPCASRSQTVVRKVSVAGSVTTLASTPTDDDPTGQLPAVQSAGGVAADAAGNTYLSNTSNHTVLKIAPGGKVSVLAGSPGAAGSSDGAGAAARFSSPTSLQVDATGNLFVLDSGNMTIRRIGQDGMVSTVVGTAGQGSLQLGALPGSLGKIGGFALDSRGNMLVTVANGLIQVKF